MCNSLHYSYVSYLLIGFYHGALAGETRQPYIRALPCAMRGFLKKATAIRPDAKRQNNGLVLACFSLLCNPGAISVSRVAFHIESEKHAILSPPLKLPGFYQGLNVYPRKLLKTNLTAA